MKQIFHQVQADASVRMLVIDTPVYPAKRQRSEMAAYARGVEYHDVGEWLHLARPTDLLIVANLRLLSATDGKRHFKGRVAALRARIAQACRRGLVVEAASGVSSADPREWAAAVRRALAWERSGGHMHGEVARVRAAKGARKGGAAIKARSAAERWAREPALYKRCKSVWRSRDFSGDAARLASINDILAHEDRAAMQIGSTATARRLFGKVLSNT